MLESLRIVLSTVSTEFTQKPFLRISLMASTPEEIARPLSDTRTVQQLDNFIEQFTSRIWRVNA